MPWMVCLGLGALALSIVVGPHRADAQEGRYATIGTGGVSGVYYAVGTAICRQMNRKLEETGINCSAEASDGSIYNIAEMRANAYNFAVVQSDWQFHAMNGTSKFSDTGPYKDLRAVFSVHPEPFTILARADAGIASFEDLKGKAVNLGPLNSGQRATAERLLKTVGWSLDDFAKVGTLDADDQTRAICDGDYDAIVYTVGHPNRSIGQAARTCKVVFVGVPDEVIAKMVEQGPYFSAVTVPADVYRDIKDDVQTFGVRGTVVTKASVPDDMVRAMVEATFEHLDDVKRMHRAMGSLDPKEMATEALTAPLHPAAKAYYVEKGLLPAGQ